MRDTLDGISCLVLGGGGFIGRALMTALIREGARVRGFGRISRFGAIQTEIPWVQGDFLDTVALAKALEGVEVVFHLAAGSAPERSNYAPIGDLSASVIGTVQMLEMCRSEGVRKVVFASSGGTVYGIPEVTPIPEVAPTFPISAYGVNKLAIEKYLHLYGYQQGLEHVSLRVSNPYGPYQDPFRRQGLVAASLLKMLRGEMVEVWGNGEVVRDYLYVEDVAEAFIRAAQYTGPKTVFNIGSGHGVSVNEVIDSAAEFLGFENVKKYLPARKADVPVNILDISLAQSELGWAPQTDWRQGVTKTFDWMRAEPLIDTSNRKA